MTLEEELEVVTQQRNKLLNQVFQLETDIASALGWPDGKNWFELIEQLKLEHEVMAERLIELEEIHMDFEGDLFWDGNGERITNE